MKQISDQPSGNLPFLKPDDIQYFDKLLVSFGSDSEELVFADRSAEVGRVCSNMKPVVVSGGGG